MHKREALLNPNGLLYAVFVKELANEASARGCGRCLGVLVRNHLDLHAGHAFAQHIELYGSFRGKGLASRVDRESRGR